MIKLKVIPRKSPKDGTVKYYVAVKRTGHIDLDTLSEEIVRECTLTEHDVKGVLSALQDNLIDELQNNRSVRLGDLGSYHVGANSKGADELEDVSLDLLKGFRIHFNKSAYMLRNFALGAEGIHFQNPPKD